MYPHLLDALRLLCKLFIYQLNEIRHFLLLLYGTGLIRDCRAVLIVVRTTVGWFLFLCVIVGRRVFCIWDFRTTFKFVYVCSGIHCYMATLFSYLLAG